MKNFSPRALTVIKKTVLIVDDSVDLRDLMSHFLEAQGYVTAHAKNGKEAIEYLLSHPLPALVLLDSEMEVMSGTEFLNELIASHPQLLLGLRIIGLSGVNRFVHPNILKSLRKPVDFNKLEEAMELAICH